MANANKIFKLVEYKKDSLFQKIFKYPHVEVIGNEIRIFFKYCYELEQYKTWIKNRRVTLTIYMNCIEIFQQNIYCYNIYIKDKKIPFDFNKTIKLDKKEYDNKRLEILMVINDFTTLKQSRPQHAPLTINLPFYIADCKIKVAHNEMYRDSTQDEIVNYENTYIVSSSKKSYDEENNSFIKIDSLNKEIERLNKTINDLKSNLAKEKSTLEEILKNDSSTILKPNEALDSSKSELNSKEHELESIQNELSSKKQELETIQNELSSKNQELESIKKELCSKETELDSKMTQQPELNNINNIKEELSKTQKTLRIKKKELKTAMENHEDKMKIVEKIIEYLLTKILNIPIKAYKDFKIEDKFQSIKELKIENVLEPIKTLIKQNTLPPPNILDYIQNFQTFLSKTRIQLTKIFDNMAPGSTFSLLFETILYGSNNNAGLKNAIDVIGLPEDRTRLIKRLGINESELLSVSKDDFFHKYLIPIFFPILNDIAKVHAYRNIVFDNCKVVDDFKRDGILVDEFDEEYKKIKKFIKDKYDIKLITVKLFHEKLNDSVHERFELNESEFTTLDYKYKTMQNKLDKMIIFDMFSVGIQSKYYTQKPVVVYNI